MPFAPLSIALSGLSSTQQIITTTTQNIANAQTPGYVDEKQDFVSNTSVGGVLPGTVQRNIDQTLLSRLRANTTSQSFSQTVASALTQIDQLNGDPAAEQSLSAQIAKLGTDFQALAANPQSATTAQQVLADAGTLANTFNNQTNSVLQLQASTQTNLANNLTTVNNDLSQIATLNQQIRAGLAQGQNVGTLQDQRDQAVNDVAKYVSVNTFTDSSGVLNVYSADYKLLAGSYAETLTQSSQYTVFNAAVNAGGSNYTVGDILKDSNGNQYKVATVSSGAITSLTVVSTSPSATALTNPVTLSNVSVTNGTATGGTVNVNQAVAPAISTSQGKITTLGGTIGAQQQLIQTQFPNFLAQLDELSRQITLQFGTAVGSTVPNTYNTATTDSTQGIGQIGIQLFTGSGNAYPPPTSANGIPPYFSGQIQVNSTLAGNLAALRSTATSPTANDASAATAAAQYLTSGTANFLHIGGSPPTSLKLTDAAAQVITGNAQAASQANTQAQALTPFQTQIQQAIASQSEVNIDTELSKLVVLQNLYAANGKVVATSQQILNSLLSIIQ